ncbi:NACHT domain-containing NTPase [Planktothrix sp. FACHB-1365]|uniref:NACHT domain-containing protein n=1 Tax=Planktothrix sp. FACHB-1365 TaxID=2692855 RepID=UPI001687CEC2|nr:HEAT repeat domain-containing protein [Planktothrix sp. FACHB-1365]MBD2480448.1 HEAT repeat domain-containing protein [Planktothrix sp. FACHB-1365]
MIEIESSFDMLSWDDFLEIVADEQGLVNADERDAFSTRFAKEHLKEQTSDASIATNLNISESHFRRHLGKVYTAFKNRYPELATDTKGKFKILHSCLTQEYRQRQEQEKLLPQPQTTISSIPDINWHQTCQSRLDAYEERFFKNNPLTGINFYVPLGLVEPKREQEKRQKQEVNPEDGSQFYQLPETEITKTYSEPNQFFEEVLRQGNSKSKGQRLAVIGEPGAGKTTLLYQIARWILQENLGYPILIRLADVDKPIRDYLTQNWLRDATGSLTGVSPEWVAGFERLMKPLPNPPLKGEGTGKHGGTNSPRLVGEGLGERSNSETLRPNPPNPPSLQGNGGTNSPRLAGEGSGERSNSPRLAGEGSGERSKQVYLLLDAVDEMGITSPLVTINQQLAEGWTQGLRVVLTCRLNVWEGEKNALRDFDVYRNLDFNSQQIQEFIEQWFNNATQSQELLKQLNETNQTRINDLIKNPLRLALLCRTWKRGQKLPETQAGLYQRLVKGHYQWKDEQKPFQIPFEVQECLHEQLGELAKNAINREQYRFRLEEKFVEQYLGKPQQENTRFDWALKLGWLNRVGLASVEERDSDQAVYAFFHPTFQEYFAALAINDWDYFLPRNHVNSPVEGKEYRIFQPQWKQVILLWLGRDDVEKGEKEAFIEKLVNFDDGCDFYCYRAYFLSAAGINEFKECSLSDEIVETIVALVLGYFDIEKQEWITFLEPIEEGTRKVLPETIREKAIANLIRVLETTESEDTRRNVANSLEKIAVGNELAIQTLIEVLETNKDEDTRGWFAYSLGKIDPGNELAIQALIRVLETTEHEGTRWRVADSLGEIAVGNELAIQALIRVLETTEDKQTVILVADILGFLETTYPGNKLGIQALIRVLETSEDELTRWQVVSRLEEIDPKNELAIQALIRVLETTEDEDTRWRVAEILGEIDPENELAIQALIRVLETTENKMTRWRVANSLEKIAVGNELAIRALIRVLETTEDEDTRWKVAWNLGRIDSGNELAIQVLIWVLETTENEDTPWRVFGSLEDIAVGNELAIRALIRVLETTENELTCRSATYSLGKIIKTQKQYADVVFAFKHNLTNEAFENNSILYADCYKLLWKCAQNLPYPKFYQAWHHNTFTPNSNNNNCHSERSEESQRSFASLRSAQDDIIINSEMSDNTPVGNTPTARQLEQQFTDICTQLPHLPLHCININKLLTLNTKNEFIQAFCNRLYQKLLPDITPPEVQTPANLETKIIHLKQQLQTPHLFILLLADGTPTPEVIDCCDYLTDVLHLGWITPDPLPLPFPQRSFVASQDNLLKAVESWVREY